MRLHYKTAEKYPRIIGEGVMTLDEIEKAFIDALADPSFARGQGIIVDVTGSESDRTHDEIRQFAVFLGERRAEMGNRMAIVVSDSLHYGLGRMLSVYAEFQHLDVAVFRQFEDAIQWMDRMTPQ